MKENGNRVEAIRLLGIAEKLLQGRDFNGSRDFAILAQETEPLLDGRGDDRSNPSGKLSITRRGLNQEHEQYWTSNGNTQNENQRSKTSTFWTACQYYYKLFEYHRAYEGFMSGSPKSNGKPPTAFPNWMHPTYSKVSPHEGERNRGNKQATPLAASAASPPLTPTVISGGSVSNSGSRNRGRPRKTHV
ncbi:hypothetical protein F3Y22_tig00116997pilonHSYRG00817 [Hibiscus syriacus]|uniref:Uncharacterized protein n=1 Tax=Hibiscus syriacus TaxID=106335 RepID=A0A6A2WGP3_HIBSY|nr:hypothetical protein F3Y22_tig00116997pilonHSYRG00817 [Hibiscus syriacus]